MQGYNKELKRNNKACHKHNDLQWFGANLAPTSTPQAPT